MFICSGCGIFYTFYGNYSTSMVGCAQGANVTFIECNVDSSLDGPTLIS